MMCVRVFLNASPSCRWLLDATGLSPLSAAHQEHPHPHTHIYRHTHTAVAAVGYQILSFSVFSIPRKKKKWFMGLKLSELTFLFTPLVYIWFVV